MRQSARIKLGGGGLNILTKDTILRGMGDFITDIDYDNIVNNRLIFEENDFIIEKTVKDKLKTFYEVTGEDYFNYLNYVILYTWERAESNLIFLNILSFEEGNLEGDMKLMLPYAEVEDLKTLNNVLKVSANFVNLSNDITKNELVKVDLFFRKQGFTAQTVS